jgi:hypothetical protein
MSAPRLCTKEVLTSDGQLPTRFVGNVKVISEQRVPVGCHGPTSGIREYNVSEAASASVLRWRMRDVYHVGDPTYLVSCLWQAQQKSCLQPHSWGRNRIQFPKRRVLKNTGLWAKLKTHRNSECCTHLQNPLQSNRMAMSERRVSAAEYVVCRSIWRNTRSERNGPCLSNTSVRRMSSEFVVSENCFLYPIWGRLQKSEVLLKEEIGNLILYTLCI